MWFGKRDVDDTHLVVDFERGLHKLRTVRRMPERCRWNADTVQDIWAVRERSVVGSCCGRVGGWVMGRLGRQGSSFLPSAPWIIPSRPEEQETTATWIFLANAKRFNVLQYDKRSNFSADRPALPQQTCTTKEHTDGRLDTCLFGSQQATPRTVKCLGSTWLGLIAHSRISVCSL